MPKKETDEEKKIIFHFDNEVAKMKLTVKGSKATEHALKIAKTFDEACTEILKEKEE